MGGSFVILLAVFRKKHFDHMMNIILLRYYYVNIDINA